MPEYYLDSIEGLEMFAKLFLGYLFKNNQYSLWIILCLTKDINF